MNSKTKGFAIVMVSIFVGCALMYLPLTQALSSSEEEGNVNAYAEVQDCEPAYGIVRLRIRLAWWFLNHSEPAEFEGKAVTLFRNMLVVDTDDDQLRVHLPPEWTVGGQLTAREMLFGSGYLSEGENITVKALSANLIDKEGLRIYLTVAYEIIDESGVYAYANLPFNIET